MLPRKPRSCDGEVAILVLFSCCCPTSGDLTEVVLGTDLATVALPVPSSGSPLRVAAKLFVELTNELVAALALVLRTGATSFDFAGCCSPTLSFWLAFGNALHPCSLSGVGPSSWRSLRSYCWLYTFHSVICQVASFAARCRFASTFSLVKSLTVMALCHIAPLFGL